MPFREHIDQLRAAHAPPNPPPSIAQATARKKPGRKATGVAVAMATLGKNLTPDERKVLTAPVTAASVAPPKPPPPAWLATHVVDPDWIAAYEKSHAKEIADIRAHQDPPSVESIIGNFEVARLKAFFDPKLFELEAGGKPGEHHVYKLRGTEHESLREKLRDFMGAVWVSAGGNLPEDQDEFDLQLDAIETKVGSQLAVLLKELREWSIACLADPDEEFDMGKLIRSVWMNWIIDDIASSDVEPRECLQFAIDNMGAHELQAVVDELRREGRVT